MIREDRELLAELTRPSPVIEGEVLTDLSLVLPAHMVEPDWKP